MGEEPIAAGGSLRRFLVDADGRPCELDLLSDIQRHISLVSDRLQALYSHDDTVFEVALSGLDGSIGIHREFSESEQAEAMRCLRLSGHGAAWGAPLQNPLHRAGKACAAGACAGGRPCSSASRRTIYRVWTPHPAGG